MVVSRAGEAGGRHGSKLDISRPGTIQKSCSERGFSFLRPPAAKQREGRAIEGRGRENRRTATETGSLDEAPITGGSTSCSNGIRRRHGA
jgi:hypothetical protein